MTVRAYSSWRDVPWNLMTATALSELEFPRQKTSKPHATVEAFDWRGNWADHDLYDATKCPPTKASVKVLEAAAARSTRPRQCADCPARSQRALSTDVGGRPLCPACASVVRLREAQRRAAETQRAAARQVCDALGWPNVVLLQMGEISGGTTGAGNARPPIAVTATALDVASGKTVLDVTFSLKSEKARIRHDGAIPNVEGRRLVVDALDGRPLIVWGASTLAILHTAAPHSSWPGLNCWVGNGRPPSLVAGFVSSQWRAQLEPDTRELVPSLYPGSLDRMLLHLRRIAATAEPAGAADG